MNWLHFFFWIAGLYLLYYLAVMLYDTTMQRSGPLGPASAELTFAEDIAPQSVRHLPDKPRMPDPKTQSPIIGSGGVSLKNLFGLAREEAIIYTRPVSF